VLVVLMHFLKSQKLYDSIINLTITSDYDFEEMFMYCFGF